ncbi:hypothetical protein QYF36_003705 [Acer negundo]|nr:hypothetical protein QYF36_003705 [Acer negundo]
MPNFEFRWCIKLMNIKSSVLWSPLLQFQWVIMPWLDHIPHEFHILWPQYDSPPEILAPASSTYDSAVVAACLGFL